MSFAHLLRKNKIMRPPRPPSRRASLVLVLDDVYDTFNVGGMYRVADAAGVSHIYHCGGTPMPSDSEGKPDSKIARASVGLYQYIPQTHIPDITSLLTDLKKQGYTLIALEQHERSVLFDTISYPQKTALIVGNETFGVHPSVLEQVDTIIEFPMYGINKSVNVVVATGIALYQIRRSMK